MRINSQKAFNFFLFSILFTSSIFFSCEEYQEGCMDSYATNYDYENEVPCCCEYPRLQLQTTLIDGENRKAFTDTFYTEDSSPFVLSEILFITSSITLTDQTGKASGPLDSLINYPVSPEILPVHARKVNSPGGTYFANDSFANIAFQIRDINELNAYEPSDFPMEHGLIDSSFYNFDRNGWNYLKIRFIVPQKAPAETRRLNFEYSGEELDLHFSIDGKWGKNKGEDLTVHFFIDIERLFRGIALDMPSESIRSLLLENMRHSLVSPL